MTEGAAGLGDDIEPALHVGERGLVQHQHAGAHGGEILQGRAQRDVGGEFVIGLDGLFRLGLRELGGGAQARENAIAGRRLGSDFGESGFRLGVFARFAQAERGLEGGAGGGGLLGLPVFIAAPGADRGDDQDGERNEVDAVTLPQLFQPFAADFLVHFVKNIGQELLQTPLTPVPERIAA